MNMEYVCIREMRDMEQGEVFLIKAEGLKVCSKFPSLFQY